MTFFARFKALYRRIFSISEIEQSTVLTLVLGSLTLSYYITFARFFYRTDTTIDGVGLGTNICWSYFQGCRDLIFLQTLPYGYSQPILYMSLFGLLVLTAYFLFKRDVVSAHMALIPAFAWHVIASLVLTNSLAGNYDYYMIIIGIVMLFLPHKLFFARIIVVLFYFLSTVAKIHPTWILGSYFSALSTGLPMFPDTTIPIWTNLVIAMEMFGSWLLLSRQRLLQRGALVFFTAFHLYSGILVGYLYPTIVLPLILILFGPLNQYQTAPLDKKSIWGWVLVILLFVGQSVALFIPGDAKLTLEGNRFGLYMFEANHQCVSEWTEKRTDGSQETFRRESSNALQRCDPYDYWFVLKQSCEREDIASIAWTFDHSINGGAFYRIVDVPDLCVLSYSPFSHNDWIRTEHDSPQLMGYPARNVYR